MSDTKERRTGILQIVMLLVVAASVNAGGFMDTARAITEQLWEHRYIPDSGLPTVPLSEYEEFDVVELFRAETIEDLEAAISDGYPMPWLEETLKDESIPWEDRYWLDCRIRAFFAQEMHTFFNRKGNPVTIEADWIRYGESYWQEHFIVNPIGEHLGTEINLETGLWGESGFVYNRFGEITGRLALCEKYMQLSRDGKTGILIHRGEELTSVYGPSYLYFVYDDKSYSMNQQELWIPFYSLSQSGDFALLGQRMHNEPNTIQLFDRNGSLLWEQTVEGNLYGEVFISPSETLCRVKSSTLEPLENYVQVFNLPTGDNAGLYSQQVLFSPSDEYACSVSSDNILKAGASVIDLSQIAISVVPLAAEEVLSIDIMSTTNMLNSFSARIVYRDNLSSINQILAVFDSRGNIIIAQEVVLPVGSQKILLSPNGVFALYGFVGEGNFAGEGNSISAIPCSIWLMEGDR